MTETELIQSVASKAPSEKFAEAVYFLQREIGISHSEIFGETKLVTTQTTESREGFIGSMLDLIFGKRSYETSEIVKGRGMNVFTFLAYLELMRNDAEERKKARKKSGMRRDLRTLGGGVG